MSTRKVPNYSLKIKKFYQYSHMFKNFEKIDSLEQIKEDIEKFKQNTNFNSSTPVLKYFKALDYLTQARQNQNYSFDERILFFILILDPEIEHYKTYLEIVERNGSFNKEILEHKVRSKLNFFDIRLLSFEIAFFKKFYNKLINRSALKCVNNLLEKVCKCENFNDLSDKDFKRLQELTYLFADDIDFNTCAFNILFQNNIFGLTTIQEQLSLFIMTVDKELNALKIYEEESNLKIVRKRMFEQFGFYNFNLIKAEKMFKNRFYPDLELTVWSKYEKIKRN